MALVSVVGLTLVVAVNTLVAGVLIRFFRLRLDTDWGTAVYVAVFVPMALVVTTMLVGAVAPGGGFDRRLAVLVAIVLPIGLGGAIDFFWMPAPEEVDLPDTT